MCVAIYKPAKEVLTKKVLHKCFKANPDGTGFAYLHKGETRIVKGLFTFKDFWVAYREHMDKESIIHFRWATHGAIEGTGMVDNCHPFEIPDGALIHNGVISWAIPHPHDTRSDTRIFTEDLMVPFIQDGMDLHSPVVKGCLEDTLGPANKVIAFYKGQHVIFNEKYGTWIDGVWFSNTSWKWDYTYQFDHAGYASKPSVRSRSLYDDDYDWMHKVEMQWEIDERKQNAKDSCSPVCEEEEETEEEDEYTEEDYQDGYDMPVCEVCSKEVLFQNQLITVSNNTRVCQECWNSLGSWQSEIDAYDRLNKPYMRMV